MASLDFEREKTRFSEYYDTHSLVLLNASRVLSNLLTNLLPPLSGIPISKIESRIKDREECIKKFKFKYRQQLEDSNTPYEIKDYIGDLVGLRIVCLYEDDIEKIGKILEDQFNILGRIDKTATIENTEDSFGYKGLHFDLKLNDAQTKLPELRTYSDLQFEVQVRTIVQDSWSVLDHKIKYKKSIPNHLKRRINTLAALFELADREFRQIRDSTEEEIHKVDTEPTELEVSDGAVKNAEGVPGTTSQPMERRSAKLNAFNFLKIANHFFSSFEFEPRKVDGFVQDIVNTQPAITRAEFNEHLRRNIALVKRYQADFESKGENRMNPFTIIRHCLYSGDKKSFRSVLTNAARDNFQIWADAQDTEQTCPPSR